MLHSLLQRVAGERVYLTPAELLERRRYYQPLGANPAERAREMERRAIEPDPNPNPNPNPSPNPNPNPNPNPSPSPSPSPNPEPEVNPKQERRAIEMERRAGERAKAECDAVLQRVLRQVER